MHMSVTFWFPPILIDIWYIPIFYVFLCFNPNLPLFWYLHPRLPSIFPSFRQDYMAINKLSSPPWALRALDIWCLSEPSQGRGPIRNVFVFLLFFFNRAIYIVGYEFWMEHISSPTAATWNVYRITHIGAWFLSSSMNAIDDGMSDPKTTRKFGKFQFANGNVWDTYGNNAIYHFYYFQFVN